MFNENFYPSPKKVQELLLDGANYMRGRVLEPSAGKGDLADAAKKKNSQLVVDTIEKELDLVSILQGKGYSVIGYDFLEFKTYTEYDLILMNPPFSDGDKHLLKAIELATNQVSKKCEIRCILNAETLKNPFSTTRQELTRLLNEFKAEITYHEELFKDAERKTNVETAVIKITIDPVRVKVSSLYSSILDSLKFEDNSAFENSLSTYVRSQELQERANDIKTLVKQYEYHIKLLRKRYESDKAVTYLEEMLPNSFKSEVSRLPEINEDIERVRTQYWEAILKTDEFAERLTLHGRRELQKQMHNVGVLEINLLNIQMLLMAVSQNAGNIMLDSCVDMFKRVTSHHQREFSTNTHYYNGWKTNEAFKINKKFIMPFSNWGRGLSESDMGLGYDREFGQRVEEIDFKYTSYDIKEFVRDLFKMLQLIDPNVSSELNTIDLGEYENETIRLKMFKKGTIHFWIKDQALLDRFNVLCGQHFNWLPTDDEIKNNAEAKKYIAKEFKGYLGYLGLTG